MSARYDAIGATYARTRRTEPRIAAHIDAALDGARTVVNLGAGTGSYEPPAREVVAVEPSPTMIAQRTPGSAPAVRAVAEALPFPDGAFDAAMAVLTVHHWDDLAAGLAEMRRVARRQVLFLFDPACFSDAWLLEYFPEILELETEQRAPGPAEIAAHLEVRCVTPVPVPADCVDGFGGCYWNRPEAYLDPVVQEGMSSFAQLAPGVRARATARLRVALASGEWDRRHGHLRELTELDIGYRLVTAGLP